MAPLGGDLPALLLEGKPVDLDHVVEHPGEDGHRLAEPLPVEPGVRGERLMHEAGQVHRPEETRAVGGQRLLAAVVYVEAVRVEGVDAGHRDVEDLGLSRGLDRPHGGREAFAVEGAAEAGERGREPPGLLGVVEPDHPLELPEVLASDDELVLCPEPVFARTAATVGQASRARLPAVPVEPRDDSSAKEHPLHLDEPVLVSLREAHADALSLIALHASVGVEETAEKAPLERRGASVHRGSDDRLATRTEAEIARQALQRPALHPVLAAPGDRVPAPEVAAMWKLARRRPRRVHDRLDPRTLVAAVHREGPRPGGKHRRVFLERSVPDEETDQVSLGLRARPAPARRLAVVVKDDLVTGAKASCLDPLGLHRVSGGVGHPANPVVGGESQPVSLLGLEVDDALPAGREESPRIGGMDGYVDDRLERLPDEIRDLPRTPGRLHPGIRGDAWVGGADFLAEPVVVHLVDFVDQNEPRLREVVGRGHDRVPHPARGERPVDAAGDPPFGVVRVAVEMGRPTAPDDLLGVVVVELLLLARGHRERELPGKVVPDRVHELPGDEEREVELAKPTVLALRPDELHRVGMAHVERRHLRAAPPAGRGHGEAHAVVDVHERERAGGLRARPAHPRPARAQGGELVPDAAPRLEGEAGLVDLPEDVVHRVPDDGRDRAVDGGGGGLVVLRPGVRDDPAGRDRAPAERLAELPVPVLAGFRGRLHARQGARDPPVGIVDVAVEGLAVPGLEPVLGVPDVEGGRLQLDVREPGRAERQTKRQDVVLGCVHGGLRRRRKGLETISDGSKMSTCCGSDFTLPHILWLSGEPAVSRR